MYQCIIEGHQLSWFRKNTKKENYEGGWFYCSSCNVQSAWIARGNMPSTLCWESLSHKESLNPEAVPFVRKVGGAPTDYQLMRSEVPVLKPSDRVPRERVRQRDLDRLKMDALTAQVEALTIKLGNVERHRDSLLLRTQKLELELLDYRRRSGSKTKATAMPSLKLKGSVPERTGAVHRP